jgi:CheY-like chemotaxis protein
LVTSFWFRVSVPAILADLARLVQAGDSARFSMQVSIAALSCHGTVLTREPFRILLAEDDAEFRQLLATVLLGDGYEVREAADGRQLLDWLATWTDGGHIDDICDLVISDIHMPGYSGLDVLSSLHCLDSPVPVIVITAFGDAATRRLAAALGAAAVLDKPFDLDDLRMTVLNVLAATSRSAPGKSQTKLT